MLIFQFAMLVHQRVSCHLASWVLAHCRQCRKKIWCDRRHQRDQKQATQQISGRKWSSHILQNSFQWSGSFFNSVQMPSSSMAHDFMFPLQYILISSIIYQCMPTISSNIPICSHQETSKIPMAGTGRLKASIFHFDMKQQSDHGVRRVEPPSPAMDKQRAERVGLIWPQPLSSATARTCPCDFP